MPVNPSILPNIYGLYILPGLVEVFEAIPEIKSKVLGNPRTVDKTPLLSHVFLRRTEAQTGQVLALRYQTIHTIWIPYQEPRYAEEQTAGLVDTLSGWLLANQTLNGRIGHGGLGGICMGGEVGLIEQVHRQARMGINTYTVIDATSEVLVKIGISHARTL